MQERTGQKKAPLSLLAVGTRQILQPRCGCCLLKSGPRLVLGASPICNLTRLGLSGRFPPQQFGSGVLTLPEKAVDVHFRDCQFFVVATTTPRWRGNIPMLLRQHRSTKRAIALHPACGGLQPQAEMGPFLTAVGESWRRNKGPVGEYWANCPTGQVRPSQTAPLRMFHRDQWPDTKAACIK